MRSGERSASWPPREVQNALASKAFRLQQSVKSIAYASAAHFGNVDKKVTETAAGPLGQQSINVGKEIDEGPQFRLICHETSAGHKCLKLMTGQAKIVKGAIDFYSSAAPYKNVKTAADVSTTDFVAGLK